jgi:cytidine deaminase
MPIYLVPSGYSAQASASADKDDKSKHVLERTLGELLPDSFGPEDLDRPRVGAGQ